MTPTRRRPPARSRRAFMKLLAAGSAAALAAPIVTVAAETKSPAKKSVPAKSATAPPSRARRPAPAAPGAHPMIPAELEKQKQSLAETLKTIRDYALPPGSPPAFVFRPLAATRGKRGGR